MQEIIQIWNIIVKSNTFNFIVMLCILVWIVKKFNIKSSLEKSKQNVVENIEKSKNEKTQGILILEDAKSEVKNLEKETSKMLLDAENQANNVVNNIMTSTKTKINQMKENVQKVVEAEEKKISARLIKDVTQKSFEKAKQSIIAQLEAHPELHEKYINESLDRL